MARRNETVVTDLRSVAKKVQSKYDQLVSSRSRGGLTWKDADPVLLRAAAVAVTEDGAGLLLSKTSDGGALCLQVWNNSSTHKMYPATTEELTEALQLIIEVAST